MASRVVQQGDGHGGVQVVAHLLEKFLFILHQNGLVHRSVRRVQGGDAGDELVEGGLGVVQVLPGEHQPLAVVALEAEESVDQGIIALLLQQGDGL